MKRTIGIVLLLTVIIYASTACGILKLDTSEVKIMEKTGVQDNPVKEQDNDLNQNPDADIKKSDLDEKSQVLQADTQEYVKSIIKERANEVMNAIKSCDVEKLAQAVHPDKGLRFSPYTFVDGDHDQVFSADQVKKLGIDSTVYHWGSYDGSGEPIELTFSDYYKRFVYDADFLSAKEVSYNKPLGQGNTTNNSFEFYKNSIIVEYHFPEIDPQYEGMDWRSLKLVFEKKDDTWFITGIIHDEWTI